MSSREIIGVQYLRGIAAVAVVIDHSAGMTAFPKYFGTTVLGGTLAYGAVGVDLFFLISGFIISTVSLRDDLSPASSVSVFAWRRFARIVPLMWLAVLSYAGLRLLGRSDAGGSYLNAFFLLPWGDVTPPNIWTLRHEMFFYAVFALTFLGPRTLRPLILLWVLAPIAYALAGLPTNPQSPWMQAVHLLTFSVNLEFGIGLAIGLAFKLLRVSQVRSRMDPLLVLSLAFIALWAVAAGIHLSRDYVLKTLLIGVVCAPILVAGIVLECPDSRANRIGLVLGNASYAIYLFHPHIVSACLGIWAKLAPHTPAAIVIIATSLIAICGGVIIHLLIERPLLQLAKWRLVPRIKPPLLT